MYDIILKILKYLQKDKGNMYFCNVDNIIVQSFPNNRLLTLKKCVKKCVAMIFSLGKSTPIG